METPRPALLLSIDFEDWHQLVHRALGVADWDSAAAPLERQTLRLLDLLDELGVKATFFLLGISAARYPELVREIVARGHEPASHGYAHERVFRQSRDEFRRDVESASELIEQLTGRRPLAYRAPAFSINRATPWAYEVLAEAGIRYDSSQYDSPRVPQRLGGIPAAPYRIALEGDRDIWELPIAVSRIGGRAVPIGGGAYWKVLPAPAIERGLRRALEQSRYAVLYFHPYEFSTEPLRARLPAAASLRRRGDAARRSAWRNVGRSRIVPRLRSIARRFALVSYEQAYADIHEHYGAGTRSLSGEGVLV